MPPTSCHKKAGDSIAATTLSEPASHMAASRRDDFLDGLGIGLACCQHTRLIALLRSFFQGEVIHFATRRCAATGKISSCSITT